MELYHGIIQGKEKTYPKGTTLYQLAAEEQPNEPYPIVLGVRNGRICELYHRATDGNRVEFLTTQNRYGMDAYRRSMVFLMLKAFYEVCGEDRIGKIEIKHSLGGNLYCEIKESECCKKTLLTQTLIDQVLEKMRELVAQKKEIRKRYIDIEEAMELFHEHHMSDKEKLFRFRKNERVPIYELDGYRDYFYGQLVYSTECLTVFDLKLYDKGFLLCLPTVKAPEKISPADIPAQLFATLSEADDWISKLGSGTVGELNEQIINGNFTQIMLVQEALQERKIAEIASRIAADRTKKFVLIAGPSSSGKTTFSKRLSIQLLAFGMKPHPVEVDDYFVDREKTPRDENGNYNFEALEAIDIDRFQSDLLALSAGEEIELPRFNFQKGLSEHSGRRLKLGQDDILILEGIHCMNDRLTNLIPEEKKFKIYLSALTQLNVDDHNHISTSDCRMIRRMVRDARTRGNDARATITMWPSVRRGEEENIFPYQEEADVMFNSTLVYELPILKQFAEPLLFTIRPDDVCYPEAKRLLDFLDHFLGVTSENVPTNSLLREFIGHSCFE